jgi:putative transcriptional regulator
MERIMVLKNRVRELRTRMNLRQSDLAAEVSVTRQTILSIEKGRLNPSILICLKIARVLREPINSVFYLAADNSDDWSTTVTHTIATGLVPESEPAELVGKA